MRVKRLKINQITEKIIGCANRVHKRLGPGLLESAYEEALSYELKSIGLKIESQIAVPGVYNVIKRYKNELSVSLLNLCVTKYDFTESH